MSAPSGAARRVREALRRRLPRLAAALAARAGYELLPRSFYSPLPDLDALGPETWDTPSALAGIDWDLDAQLAWARAHVAPGVGALHAPDHGSWGEPVFFWENRSFQTGDAEVLHGLIRTERPARVVELGSGFSSLVIRDALGGEGTHAIYDPHPRLGLTAHPVRAQDVPLEVVARLQAGDLLFVDTTHTVRTGGDVTRIVLEILPALAPGVLVHFHDIWLPWEYHPALVVGERRAWAEQYLLQAFLAFNERWEVLLGLAALARERPEELRALVPTWRAEHFPSSLYIRRRAP